MPTIAAYFDESVRTDGRAPICVGGFLFKAPEYERFVQRWRREVLRLPNRTQLRHFHMTDLCAGHGEYKGLSIPTRVAIFDRAIDVIQSCIYGSVSVHFLQHEFEAVAPRDWPQFRGSIYSAACHVCVQATAQALAKWRCHLEVRYVFEQGHKFQGEADDVLKAISRHAQARKDFRYRSHSFTGKSEPGLQAADLLVWWVTKVTAARDLGAKAPNAVKPFLPGMRRLGSIKEGRQILHDLTGDKLFRFIKEQANLATGLVVPVEFQRRKTAFY